MQRTRQQILDYTKRHGPAAVDILATELGVVPVTIRAHIAILEKENLLKGEEVRNGRAGRPRIVYSLTDEARNSFPKSYDHLATRLLDALVAQRGQEEISRLLESVGRAWGSQLSPSLHENGLEEKVEMVTEALSREGCEAEWERRDNAFLIRFHNCPYTSVVEEYPQLCSMEQAFLERTLELPVEIRQSGSQFNYCLVAAGPLPLAFEGSDP